MGFKHKRTSLDKRCLSRRELGEIVPVYEEVLQRLLITAN